MAKSVCILAFLLVAAVTAERISSNSRDNTVNSRDFGWDSRTSGSRAGSVNRGVSGNRWVDSDDAAENDFSTPTITAWKGGIVPYEISSDISSGNTAALKRMFQDISEKTCVKFQPKRLSDSNYVTIKSGNKCSAPLGMKTSSSGGRGSFSSSWGSGTVSNVVLGQSCFTTQRVGRRIMNLLGIPHETSRPDRDQFVEINFSNLRTGYTDNLKQIAASAYLPGVLDIDYDLHSITQYSDDDLARDSNTWAIRPKGRNLRSTQLGGETFSTADFEKIRKAYRCAGSGTRG